MSSGFQLPSYDPEPAGPAFELPEFKEPERRTLWGWLLLILLLGVMVMGASYEYFSRNKYEVALRGYLQSEQGPSIPGTDVQKKELEKVLMQLEKDSAVEEDHRAIYRTAIRTELKQNALPEDLRVLRESGSKKMHLFARVQSADSLPKDEARRIAKELSKGPYIYQLTAQRALEKAGIEREQLITLDKGTRFLIAAALVLLLFTGGMGSIVTFFVLWLNRKIRPEGTVPSPAEGDSLAARGALCLFGALALQGLVVVFGDVLSSMAVQVLYAGSLVLTVAFIIPNVTISGFKHGLRRFGFGRIGFGKALAWAVGGSLAVWPLVIATSLLSQVLFRNLPPPEHPITIDMGGPINIWGVLALLLLASVFAPVWEEIAFRGFMFPAFSALFRSPLVGGALSSLAFGAIHSTGIPAWLPLAAIGAVSCVLYHYTRSLLPCILLHGLHNGITLVVAMLALGV